METNLNISILKPFFEDPNKEFYIRELSRLLKINHTTIRLYLNRFVKDGYLKKIDSKPFPMFKLDLNKKTLNLKLYYNLEKIRKSNLVEILEKEYEYPVIVLFGSYSYAKEDKTSDVDICIISNISKEINLEKYEKTLNRKISLHIFNKRKFLDMIEKKSDFVNNILNGIVLSGQLEIF